jgi:hypothetical protein
MRCVQFSWVFILFYVFDQSQAPKLKTTCFDWGKQNKHLNLFYFQHLQLLHSKTDDANFLRGAFTPSKLQLV